MHRLFRTRKISCNAASLYVLFAEEMVPDNGLDQIQHKHEVKLELAEECMFLLQAYFMDIGTTTFPMFEKWKNYSFHPPTENLRNAYIYYKKALQCIFYKGK